MNETKIAWADYSWNPVTGCSPASEGCTNCYARAMNRRFGKGDFSVKFHPERMEEPIRHKKPAKIFVCSTSDLFHEDLPDGPAFEVLGTMRRCPQHTFIIVTKRAGRMADFFKGAPLLPNVILMATVENQPRADERTPYLLELARAGWRIGLSIEPMLGPINLNAVMGMLYPFPNGWEMLSWVIVGGETGQRARECCEEWIKEIFDDCREAKVPFFFKQFGDNFIPTSDCGTDECQAGVTAGRFCAKCYPHGDQGEEWLKRREWPL